MSLILNQAHDRATNELPPGVDPSEYAIIIPGPGRVSRAYGAGNPGRAAVVADEDSNVAASCQGERHVEVVIEALGGL